MSAEEDMYVRENFFVASGGAEFWIGLNDIIQEGQFRYVRERDSEISYKRYWLIFVHSHQMGEQFHGLCYFRI